MELYFYPYDFEYKLRNGISYVYLYSKLPTGEKIAIIHHYQPYFFTSLDNINESEFLKKMNNLTIATAGEPAKIVSWEKVEKELLGKKYYFLKIYVNYPKAVPLISKELESWNLKCYEKDILFIHRYLRDMHILPMTLTKATGELQKSEALRIPIFNAEEILPASSDSLKKWKMLAIDIETYSKKKEIDPERNPILMIGLYGKDEQDKEFYKVLTWKVFPYSLDYLEILASEEFMIKRAKEIIINYQPDILLGYFSDGFDLPYLKTRAEKYKIKLTLGVDNSEIETGRRADFRDGESKITGILHLDVLKFIRNIFGKNLKTDTFSLDAVSYELLGHKKHQVNLEQLAPAWDKASKELESFCEYNLHDARLTLQLADKLLSDILEFTKIIGLPTYDIIRMRFSRLVESFIMRRAINENVVAPNKPNDYELDQRMKESIQGAFVFEPTPGIYKDIFVFDFRSLYPTIISAHNLGPEGFHCSCCGDKNHVPEKEEYWFCQEEKKFIPKVLDELINLRAEFKRQLKQAKAQGSDTKYLEARSYTVKVLANAFYGYLGFYGARWYCIECAASTTAYARDYIKTTIYKAEQTGFKVIYADTDSCFLLLGTKTKADALHFMNSINENLPGQMELELEGYYPRGIFVAIKGTEKGAKKKYALLSDNDKIKITGFETVRRNWSILSKEIQEQVLKLVLQDKVQESFFYVRQMIKDLQTGKIAAEKLIIKTQITRELSQYSAVGPHVTIARKMQQRGDRILPGTMIEYIIVKGSGLVRDRAKIPSDVKPGEYDSEYYIHHQILPAVNSIFAVLGYSEEDIVKESSQMGLGKFFGS